MHCNTRIQRALRNPKNKTVNFKLPLEQFNPNTLPKYVTILAFTAGSVTGKMTLTRRVA